MFYDRYIELCVTSGEKPYSVAKKLGLSNSNVAQWKKGSTPRKEVLQRIAEYFNVSVAYLMGLEELPSTLELIAEDNGFESAAKMLREFRQKEKPPAQSGEPPKYDQLTSENRAIIDDLIEKLLKSQSGG